MHEKIVVIGSNSFSGGHLVHHALSQGFHVLGLSSSAKKSIPFNPYDWKTGGRHSLALKQLDSSDHPNKAATIINDYQPNYIIHCADDGLIEIHNQLENKPSIIIIPTAHIYGPGQQVHELIPKIILSILLEKKFPLHNRDHAMRPFIHINDITAGIFKVTCEGVPGKTYSLTTNRFISVRDLATLICSRMNVTLEDVVTIVNDGHEKTADGLLEKVSEHHELDWQPNIELEEGIDSVIAWVQEWLPALKNHSVDLED